MDTIENIYIVFNNILNGCKTMLDAFYFAEKIINTDNNQQYRDLLIGMIHNKKYDKVLDMRTLAHSLSELNNLEYKEDIDDYINTNMKNKIDLIQLNTFMRFSRNKKYKNNFDTKNKVKLNVKLFKKNESETVLITKQCPHCGITTRVPQDTSYIICGYSNDSVGYDWSGCGKDWCGRCNKKLCKSWDKDKLFVNTNRTHNKQCCREYAESNLEDINNYCSC